MDSELKGTLVASAVQALAVPLAKTAISSHYQMKQLERREEMELKVAERRSRGFAAMRGEQPQATGRIDPVSLESPGDVYDEIEQLRTQTDCEFCHGVMDQLMEAPPNEAKAGYEELRSYVREVERLKQRDDISDAEVQQSVEGLVESWEVVPKYSLQMG